MLVVGSSLGWLVGNIDGDVVGIVDGDSDGEEDGNLVGVPVKSDAVGEFDGIAEGALLPGSFVGKFAREGSDEGIAPGKPVGGGNDDLVGNKVGLSDGLFVWSSSSVGLAVDGVVGCPVGIKLGSAVGVLIVGTTEGIVDGADILGAMVGMDVGFMLGCIVGYADGCWLLSGGVVVGEAEGLLLVATSDGESLGICVNVTGNFVGISDGGKDIVGWFVGAGDISGGTSRVGDVDGTVVGTTEGKPVRANGEKDGLSNGAVDGMELGET